MTHSTTPLRVGDVLAQGSELGYEPDGFCGGMFGRDSYEIKRVEAIGADWVVVRNESGQPEFAAYRPEELIPYRQ